MSFMTRGIRCALIAAALAHGALPLSTSGAVAASKSEKKAAAPASGEEASKAAANDAAKRAYEGGVKAYQAGKYQNAVDQFNVALRGGGLATTEMARGLYYRGVAYRKLSKPGLAISDLTSALWLKNGLSDAERASATSERAEAYKAAGVADQSNAADAARASAAANAPAVPAPVPQQAKTAAAPPAVPAAQATPAPASSGDAFKAPAATTQPAASDGGFPQPLTMGAETAAPPAPKYARTDDKVTSGGAVNQAAALEQPYTVAATSAVPAPAMASAPASSQPVLSAAPMDQPAAPAGNVVSAQGVGSAISGFFSNVFGGSTSPTQAPAAVQTASTTGAQPVSPQTSSWESTSLTQTSKKGQTSAKAATPQPVQTAAVAPAAAPAPKVKGGKFKVHIAAVRSRAEAEALAQKLNAEHGQAFASRTASVDEAVIGSMGTFYRVRVGSYATADEPRGLCNSLRNSGYDCLVVSN